MGTSRLEQVPHLTAPLERRFGIVQQAIRLSWHITTSMDNDGWNPDHRERGQALPSALVIQDYLGGTIIRGCVTPLPDKRQHYINDIDGQRLDIISTYLGASESLSLCHLTTVNRESLLSMEPVLSRYEALRESTDFHVRWIDHDVAVAVGRQAGRVA